MSSYSDQSSGHKNGSLAAGEHIFEFQYTKDSSYAYYEDAVWIDNLYIGTGPKDLVYLSPDAVDGNGDAVTFSFTGFDAIPGATVQAKGSSSFKITID